MRRDQRHLSQSIFLLVLASCICGTALVVADAEHSVPHTQGRTVDPVTVEDIVPEEDDRVPTPWLGAAPASLAQETKKVEIPWITKTKKADTSHTFLGKAQIPEGARESTSARKGGGINTVLRRERYSAIRAKIVRRGRQANAALKANPCWKANTCTLANPDKTFQNWRKVRIAQIKKSLRDKGEDEAGVHFKLEKLKNNLNTFYAEWQTENNNNKVIAQRFHLERRRIFTMVEIHGLSDKVLRSSTDIQSAFKEAMSKMTGLHKGDIVIRNVESKLLLGVEQKKKDEKKKSKELKKLEHEMKKNPKGKPKHTYHRLTKKDAKKTSTKLDADKAVKSAKETPSHSFTLLHSAQTKIAVANHKIAVANHAALQAKNNSTAAEKRFTATKVAEQKALKDKASAMKKEKAAHAAQVAEQKALKDKASAMKKEKAAHAALSGPLQPKPASQKKDTEFDPTEAPSWDDDKKAIEEDEVLVQGLDATEEDEDVKPGASAKQNLREEIQQDLHAAVAHALEDDSEEPTENDLERPEHTMLEEDSSRRRRRRRPAGIGKEGVDKEEHDVDKKEHDLESAKEETDGAGREAQNKDKDAKTVTTITSDGDALMGFYVNTDEANADETMKVVNAVLQDPTATGLTAAIKNAAQKRNVHLASSFSLSEATKPQVEYVVDAKTAAYAAKHPMLSPSPAATSAPTRTPTPPTLAPSPQQVAAMTKTQLVHKRHKDVEKYVEHKVAMTLAPTPTATPTRSPNVTQGAVSASSSSSDDWVIWVVLLIAMFLVVILVALRWWYSYSPPELQVDDGRIEEMLKNAMVLQDRGAQDSEDFQRKQMMKSPVADVKPLRERMRRHEQDIHELLSTVHMLPPAADLPPWPEQINKVLGNLDHLKKHLCSLLDTPDTGPRDPDKEEAQLQEAMLSLDHVELGEAVANAIEQVGLGQITEPPSLQQSRKVLADMDRASSHTYCGCKGTRQVEDCFRNRTALDQDANFYRKNSTQSTARSQI